MPRTEPAPTCPLPTSWNTDFAGNRPRAAAPRTARNRFARGTSQRSRQNGGVGASQCSPSVAGERPHVVDRRATVLAREPRRDAEREVEAGDDGSRLRERRSRSASRRDQLPRSMHDRAAAHRGDPDAGLPAFALRARPVDRDHRRLAHAAHATRARHAPRRRRRAGELGVTRTRGVVRRVERSPGTSGGADAHRFAPLALVAVLVVRDQAHREHRDAGDDVERPSGRCRCR